MARLTPHVSLEQGAYGAAERLDLDIEGERGDDGEEKLDLLLAEAVLVRGLVMRATSMPASRKRSR